MNVVSFHASYRDQSAIPWDNDLPDPFVDVPPLEGQESLHNIPTNKIGRSAVYGKTNTETTDLQNINMTDTDRYYSVVTN